MANVKVHFEIRGTEERDYAAPLMPRAATEAVIVHGLNPFAYEEI